MIAAKKLPTLALMALLAGCGGGDVEFTRTSTGITISSLRGAGPASPLAVTRESAAEQLLDAAEARYPDLFPSHQPTQSFAPFLYRYYPQTGIHVGVVVSVGGYPLDAVYVAGGPFGTIAQPTYVGMLTDFITPVEPGGNNGCFDLALMETEGTHAEIGYLYSGMLTGNEFSVTTVGGLTAFEGSQAREITTVSNGAFFGDGQSFTMDTVGRTYSLRTGPAQMTNYGFDTTSTIRVDPFVFSTGMKMVYQPPFIDASYSLAPGASWTGTQTGTATMTYHGPFGEEEIYTIPLMIATTIRYVGREQVSVPAGTYDACRFEVTSSDTPDVDTQWVVYGKGFAVQTLSVTPEGTQTTQATSMRLNGIPL